MCRSNLPYTLLLFAISIFLTTLAIQTNAALFTFQQNPQGTNDLGSNTSYGLINAIPTSNDHIIIPSNSIATVSAHPFSCKSILINSNSTLIVRNTLNFSSGITIEAGATVILQEGGQLITTMSTWLAPGSSAQPNISFPTISVNGSLVLYPNTKVAGTIQGNSENIAPPLIVLISGICRVIALDTPGSTVNVTTNTSLLFDSPTIFQNTRIVTFSSGIFLYGNQYQTSSGISTTTSNNASKLMHIQPIIFDFVLFNVNASGTLLINGDIVGAQILTLAQFNSMAKTKIIRDNNNDTVRPHRISIASGGQFIIQFTKASALSSASIANNIQQLGLWVDVQIDSSAKFNISTTTSSPSTSSTSTLTSSSPHTVAIFGTFNAESNSIFTLGSDIVLTISAQQCAFKENSLLTLSPRSTLRSLLGTTLFNGNIDAQNDSTIEIYAVVQFASSSTTLHNIKLFSGSLSLGTDLLTTPTQNIQLNIMGQFIWDGHGLVTSIGAGTTELRPRRELIISSSASLILTNGAENTLNRNVLPGSTGDSDRDSGVHVLRHTIITNRGQIYIMAPLSLQDNSQIISYNSATVTFASNSGLITSSKNLQNNPMIVNSSNSNTLIVKNVNSNSLFVDKTGADMLFMDNSVALFSSTSINNGVNNNNANNNNNNNNTSNTNNNVNNNNGTTKTIDSTEFDVSILFSTVTIVPQQLANSTAIFIRPVVFQRFTPWTGGNGTTSTNNNANNNNNEINPLTTFHFVFDNALNHYSTLPPNTNILTAIVPTVINHPYLSFSFVHLNQPQQLSLNQQIDWNIHTLRIINSNLQLTYGFNNNNNNALPATTTTTSPKLKLTILQLGDSTTRTLQGTLIVPAYTITTGFMYLFKTNNPVMFNTMSVKYGLYIFPSTIPSSPSLPSTNTIHINANEINFTQTSSSLIEQSVFFDSKIKINILGAFVIKPGITIDGIDVVTNNNNNNVANGGIVMNTMNVATTTSTTNNNNASTITIAPTGRFHFTNSPQTITNNNGSSSNIESEHISPTSNINMYIINNGIIDLATNSQVIITKPIQSRPLSNGSSSNNVGGTNNNGNNSNNVSNIIFLGDDSTLTLTKTIPKTTNDNANNNSSNNVPPTTRSESSNISNIGGTKGSLILKSADPVVFDTVNVGFVDIDDTKVSFNKGVFAFSQQSMTISPLQSNVSFTTPTTTSNTPATPTTTLPITELSNNGNNLPIQSNICPNSNPTTLINPPRVHVCPKTTISKFDVLLWVFLALFLLFFVISIILAIFPVVCLRRNYEKRLKEANAIGRRRSSIAAAAAATGTAGVIGAGVAATSGGNELGNDIDNDSDNDDDIDVNMDPDSMNSINHSTTTAPIEGINNNNNNHNANNTSYAASTQPIGNDANTGKDDVLSPGNNGRNKKSNQKY